MIISVKKRILFITALLVLFIGIVLGQSNKVYAAPEKPVLDFTVTEKINMTGDGKTPNLTCTPLEITNNNTKASLDISLEAKAVSGWELVADTVDFTKLPKDSKKISLLADGKNDMLKKHDIQKGMSPGEKKTIMLSGKTGLVTSELKDTKVLDLVVMVKEPDPIPCLSKMTWDEITEISKSGKAEEYFNNGDIADKTVNGHNCMKSGCTKEAKINGETVEMHIVGFNHDDMADGSGKAGITFGMVDCLSNTMPVDATDNTGGWPEWDIRNTLQGYSVTDTDGKAINVATVNKYSDAGTTAGNGKFTTSKDKLWLFSEKELTGHTYYTDGANGSKIDAYTKSDGSELMYALDDESKQYEYFTYLYDMKNATTKWSKSISAGQKDSLFADEYPSFYKKIGTNGSANYWWLRSSRYRGSDTACDVSSTLCSFNGNIVDFATGICVGFCLPGEKSVTLVTGNEFKSIVSNGYKRSLVFTDEKAPDSAKLTDVSAAKDMGVVAWLEDTTYKVSTQRTGKKVVANKDCSYMFSWLSLSSYNFDFLDTSKVENMSYMFSAAGERLDLSSFDTSNVTNMEGMFMDPMYYYSAALHSLNISSFDTSKVENMSYMFYGCIGLENLDVSNFNTSNVKNMNSMFEDLYSGDGPYGSYTCNLKKLDLSNFDMSSIVSMTDMFGNSYGIEEIKLGSKFKWVGTDGYLPAPNTACIPGANGKWYNSKDVGFLPEQIPSGVADTYYATSRTHVGGTN